VAGVAHEVRNPLFSITATLDAIESTMEARPEFVEHAVLLRSQVGRLTQLTRDLLDYGRPSALQRTPTDLAGVVRRAARACATLSKERKVAVAERIAADLPRLALDGARMEQALENLITERHPARAAGLGRERDGRACRPRRGALRPLRRGGPRPRAASREPGASSSRSSRGAGAAPVSGCRSCAGWSRLTGAA
jgi:nitrogen-specific signal transduction histidine kinase